MGVFVSFCPQVGVLRWFTRSMTLSTCLRGMTKNSSFLRLWTFPWAIVYSFAVPWRFTRNKIVIFGFYVCFRELLPTVFVSRVDLQGPWYLVYFWEVWPRTCRFYILDLSFLHFRAIFVSYCPQFWGSVKIYKEYDNLYIFERNDKNSSFLRLWAFSWALAHSFGVPGWFTRSVTLNTCLRGMTKNSSFLHLWPFLWAIAHSFGVPGCLQGPWHSVHVWEAWPKTHHFCVLGTFSWSIAHSFGVPGWFTRSMTLSTCLRGMAKNSSFLRFRDIFVSYCPQFCGSMMIYKEYDSLYILERNAKKHVVFVFMAIFVSYCPQFWCPWVIYQAHDTQYIFERHDHELVVLTF
jgi:hypothetical protein